LLGSSLLLQIAVNSLKVPPVGPDKTEELDNQEANNDTDHPSVPMTQVQSE